MHKSCRKQKAVEPATKYRPESLSSFTELNERCHNRAELSPEFIEIWDLSDLAFDHIAMPDDYVLLTHEFLIGKSSNG